MSKQPSAIPTVFPFPWNIQLFNFCIARPALKSTGLAYLANAYKPISRQIIARNKDTLGLPIAPIIEFFIIKTPHPIFNRIFIRNITVNHAVRADFNLIIRFRGEFDFSKPPQGLHPFHTLKPFKASFNCWTNSGQSSSRQEKSSKTTAI